LERKDRLDTGLKLFGSLTSSPFFFSLTLPYLRGGQALTPAQRWGRISSAQCASQNVTTRLQVTAIKPWTAVKPYSAVKPKPAQKHW